MEEEERIYNDEALFMGLCQQIWNHRGHPAPHTIIRMVLDLRRCLWCGAPFANTDPRTESCSQSCGQMARRQKGTKDERRIEHVEL